MASVADIKDGIKTRLATVTGLRAHDTWPDQVNIPAAIPRLLAGPEQMSMGAGVFRLQFEIILFAAGLAGGLSRAQDAVDVYLKTVSGGIKTALEADKTLSGNAQTISVGSWQEYGDYEEPPGSNIHYLGAKLPLEVWAT